MKRILPALLILLILFGCDTDTAHMDDALALRNRLLDCSSCEFTATVSADYGSEIYSFKMHCKSTAGGNLTFEVLQPASIAGITGTLSGEGGKLTFDEHALLFSLMAGDRISPVSAPWIMLRALRSGYIRSSGKDGDLTVIHIDDSYESDALQLIFQLNNDEVPLFAEIFYKDTRILTIIVENFTTL